MSPGLAGASLPSALNAMPTAAAAGLLCAAVIVEIVVLPAVLLPGCGRGNQQDELAV